MTRGCWPTLDYFITCSYTLHHPEGDPCESWGSGISFKGVTSRAIEKCFLTPAMQAFNTCMSHVRIAVEWLSGDTANYLSLQITRKTSKLASVVWRMYLVCAILRNALTCLYGNTTSKFFLSGVSKIIRVLYLNVFRNISTLKISKNHISENSCLNNQNYTSACKVK